MDAINAAPQAQAFDLESGEKIVAGHGKRPEVAAVAACLVTQKGPDGINRNVQKPAVARVPEGPHRITLTVQGEGQVTVRLTPREAWQLAEKVFELAGWLEVQLALPEGGPALPNVVGA
jgi:hypothetical protein